ncbi:hypothetical protein [Bradyrhizobium sp. BR13661]|nr:hypothetical protein [Bradyrhizobium sp. BR13661]MDH6261414.1 hypothetical protein [Bradyrhizobium sp. BR13661]
MTNSCRWPIVGLIALAALITPAKAAEDLSSFGTPVETTTPARPVAQSKARANKLWSAEVCAEIQRIENVVISGPLHPSDRGMARGGLLMLEQLHCGIDVSEKLAADEAVLENEQRKAQRTYEKNMDAAQRAAERAAAPREPIIIQVPQPAPASSLPDPPATVNCSTTRLGGGMSSTTCR